jgi:hypothetical protein
VILTAVLWFLVVAVGVAACAGVIYLIVRFVNRGDSIAVKPSDRAQETPPRSTPPT